MTEPRSTNQVHAAWVGLPGGVSLPFFRRLELRTGEGGFVWANHLWLA